MAKLWIVQGHTGGKWGSFMDPMNWSVRKGGRETATRIYELAEKPTRRWASDPYWSKDELVGLFETEAEAQAFAKAAYEATAEAGKAFTAAHRAYSEADRVKRAAREALDTAIQAFVKEQGQ